MDTGTPSNVTATAQIFSKPATLLGFYVNSTTGGTIIIADSDGVTSAAISGTITPAIGWHSFPASLSRGLQVTIANTLNVTLFWNP